MLFLNNAFTKDITEYDGEVLKEVKTVDGKIICCTQPLFVLNLMQTRRD